MIIASAIIGVLVLLVCVFGIRIVQQTHRGVVERFGRFNRVCQPGLNLIIPIIEHMEYRNMTERLADVDSCYTPHTKDEEGERMSDQEELEPQGYRTSTCSCCGGIKTEVIYGRKYVEPVVQLPKKCDCK